MIGLPVILDVVYELNRYMYKSHIDKNQAKLYHIGDLIKIILFEKDEVKYYFLSNRPMSISDN